MVVKIRRKVLWRAYMLEEITLYPPKFRGVSVKDGIV